MGWSLGQEATACPPHPPGSSAPPRADTAPPGGPRTRRGRPALPLRSLDPSSPPTAGRGPSFSWQGTSCETCSGRRAVSQTMAWTRFEIGKISLYVCAPNPHSPLLPAARRSRERNRPRRRAHGLLGKDLRQGCGWKQAVHPENRASCGAGPHGEPVATACMNTNERVGRACVHTCARGLMWNGPGQPGRPLGVHPHGPAGPGTRSLT